MPDIPREIIVVGSGVSQDQLSAIDLLSHMSAITKVIISKRQNQAVARNIGIKIANQKYTCFFDVDDRPHALKFAITKKVLVENDEIDYLLHSHCSPDSSEFDFNFSNINMHSQLIEDPSGFGLASLCHGRIHHGHLTVKTETIRRLELAYIEHAGGKGREDSLFVRALHRKGLYGVYINAPLVSYEPSALRQESK
jgi:glycosyltransferase involved in cell wall biosynthesis